MRERGGFTAWIKSFATSHHSLIANCQGAFSQALQYKVMHVWYFLQQAESSSWSVPCKSSSTTYAHHIFVAHCLLTPLQACQKSPHHLCNTWVLGFTWGFSAATHLWRTLPFSFSCMWMTESPPKNKSPTYSQNLYGAHWSSTWPQPVVNLSFSQNFQKPQPIPQEKNPTHNQPLPPRTQSLL